MPGPVAIATTNELANHLGLTRRQLIYWAFLVDAAGQYTAFSVPKRSGGARTITAPTSSLRDIQRRLLDVLNEYFSPRASVHGFAADRSILTNASEHIRRRFIFNVDLKDFFPTINFGRVRGALIAKPMNLPPAVATIIARLACHDNQLPQGAPTSPLLSNLVCMRLDGELQRLAHSLGCRYTRYADDLTFSTNKRSFPRDLGRAINKPYGTHAVVGPRLAGVIGSNGFLVNESKVRLCARKLHAQRVTGLTVNEFPNVHRSYVRQIRAMIHAWQKFGLANAEAHFRQQYLKRHRAGGSHPPSFARVVHGKLMFLAMVRGQADPVYLRFAKECRKLSPALFASALDKEDILDRNVWVLESDESQGTGFFLANVGLVTCAHVLGPNTVAFHFTNPSVRYPVDVIRLDADLDLAVLKMDGPTPSGLEMGDARHTVHHARIMVAGHPNYGVGDELYKHWGSVAAKRRRHGVRYIIPSTPIASGNSGGPVVDERFRVIGVAQRGVKNLADSAVASPDVYGVIVVDHLTEMGT